MVVSGHRVHYDHDYDIIHFFDQFDILDSVSAYCDSEV